MPGIVKDGELKHQGLIIYDPETGKVDMKKPADAVEDYRGTDIEVCILLSGARGTNRRVD
jgi:hypothetical protein